MTYTLAILRKAQKEMADLTPETYSRVKTAVHHLADDPRPQGSKKLVGRPAWRLRVGSYRVVYEIDEGEKRVTIMHIGHRRDIYR